MEKWLCTECAWVGPNDKILRAPNPFADDDSDTMCGCPNCRGPNCLVRACDEVGCMKEASNGTPTPNGYRCSCYEHRPASLAVQTGQQVIGV